MSAGLSRGQFSRVARLRLREIAAQVGGTYENDQVLCPDGIRLQFRRINASNGEAAGILQAVNGSTGKVVEGLPVLEMIKKAKTA